MTRGRRLRLVATLLLALPYGCAFTGSVQDPKAVQKSQVIAGATPPADKNPSPYQPCPTPAETPQARADAAVRQAVRDEGPPPPEKPPEPVPIPPEAVTPPQPPPPPDPPLLAALRALLEHHPDKARELLEQTQNASPQETVALLQAALLREGGLDHAEPAEVAALLEQLDVIRAELRAAAPLQLRDLCFYKKEVHSYGTVEPLPETAGGPAFQAGVGGLPGEQVQVYVEVRNPRCRFDGHVFETRLAATLTVLDGHGEPVSQMDFRTDRDLCRRLRQDHFLTFSFWVPPHTPPGSYTLKVEVRDVGFDKDRPRAAAASLDFRVVENARTVRRD